jgi:hypothetical protein
MNLLSSSPIVSIHTMAAVTLTSQVMHGNPHRLSTHLWAELPPHPPNWLQKQCLNSSLRDMNQTLCFLRPIVSLSCVTWQLVLLSLSAMQIVPNLPFCPLWSCTWGDFANPCCSWEWTLHHYTHMATITQYHILPIHKLHIIKSWNLGQTGQTGQTL